MGGVAQWIGWLLDVLRVPFDLLPYTWWMYVMATAMGVGVGIVGLVRARSNDPRWKAHLRYMGPLHRGVVATAVGLASIYVFVLAGFWVLVLAAGLATE